MADELLDLRPALRAAIDRFGRDILRQARTAGQRRTGPFPTRLPPPRLRRPVPHRLAHPQRLVGRAPLTVLDVQRRLEARLRGEPPSLAAALKESVERLAQTIRERLLALRSGLRRFGDSFIVWP